jgi:prepilin-type N-terminal cleavage/methylation domain-containing protein
MDEDRARRLLRRRTDRGGFTILELIIAIAIMSMIAATVTPVLFGAVDRERLDTAEKTLTALATAVSSFRADVERSPASLQHLGHPIAITDGNLCDLPYAARYSGWNGSYLQREVPVTGIPIGIGRVQNRFVPHGSPLPHPTTMRIVVTGVTLDDALLLNQRIDADGSATEGTIQWVATSTAGTVELYYVIPSPRCV